MAAQLQPENMGALFTRYSKDCAAFNRLPGLPDHDPEFKRRATAMHRSENRFRRAPIHTKEDALTAMKYIESELDNSGAWDFMRPLFRSLRTYIEGRDA